MTCRAKRLSLSAALGSILFFPSAVILVALAKGQPAPSKPPIGNGENPYFSVWDSIEMARFVRDDPEIKQSPSKNYYAVVTTRGIVESDRVESTLWIFRNDKIKKLLTVDSSLRTLLPRVAVRLAAIPRARTDDSYEPLISDVRWTIDSNAILFLGQSSPEGNRRLFMVSSRTDTASVLTLGKYDVSQYDSVRGTIVYRAGTYRAPTELGEAINPDARDVTAIPLEKILPVSRRAQDVGERSELWAIRNGRNIPVIDSQTRRPFVLWNFPRPISDYNPLSLSPDGRSVVVLQAVRTIPKSWESYEPAFESNRIHSRGSGGAASLDPFAPTQYVLVDLNNGKATPLINAPNAWALGYGDANLARWSPDRTKLLLTNTYLPLDEEGLTETRRSARRRPCAAAVTDLSAMVTTCVAFSRGRMSSLEGAEFSGSGDDVVLCFGRDSIGERFRYENGYWESINRANDQRKNEELPERIKEASSESEDLSLSVKQDLDTPPTLWAVERVTGRSAKIWDPNPWLAAKNLGHVSVLHWKDSSGYEWTGGLVTPPNYVSGKRYPLVIQTHGFSEDEFMTDGAFTTAFAARPLAAAGIVVLQIEDRFDDLVTMEEAPNRILAFESAIDHLAAEGIVDPKRVGIIGFSRTCYYVESALIRDPTRFAAATIADGVDVSYMQYLLFANSSVARESEQVYGTPPFGDGLRRWVEHAPGFNLARVRTPVRIEAIGPISVLGEWEIYGSLSKQAKPVDLIYFPDGQHILQKPLERMASQQGNLDWFRFWLKGEEDPDPAKVEQYKRWRELRKLQEHNEKTANAASPTSD